MMEHNNGGGGGSKLLTPGFSRLRAPTTIVKKNHEEVGPPIKVVDQDLNQAEQPAIQKQITQRPSNITVNSQQPVPKQAQKEKPPEDNKPSKQIPSLSKTIGKGTVTQIGKGLQNQQVTTTVPVVNKSNNNGITTSLQQTPKQTSTQKASMIDKSQEKPNTKPDHYKTMTKIGSGIGKGIKSVQETVEPAGRLSLINKKQPTLVKIDEEEHHPFQDQDQSPFAQSKLENVIQPKRSVSVIGKFGFRGGLLGQAPMESQPREEIAIKIPQRMSPIKEVTHQSAKKEELQQRLEHAKLEDTIKNLEQNLAALPTTFNRVSRLKEFTPLVPPPKVQNFQAQLQIQLQNIETTHPTYLEPLAQPVLRDRFLSLRDKKKQAKLTHELPQEDISKKFDEVLSQVSHKGVEFYPSHHEDEVEERNLPLTAFLPKNKIRPSLIQQEPPTEEVQIFNNAPLGDADSQNEDDLLLNEQDENPFAEELKEEVKVEQPKLLKECSSQSGSEKQQRLSITAKYRLKNKVSALKKAEETSSLAGASAGVGAHAQSDIFSSFSSNSMNPNHFNPNGSMTSSGLGFQQQSKTGLSACQRRGPGLAPKKAFDHKKKRFTRELNHESLSKQEDDPRFECEHCCRRFNPDVFDKHFAICEKVFIKRRKEFNALKQRAINPEHLAMIEKAQQKYSFYTENQKLNTKWQTRRAQLRAAIAAARGGIKDLKKLTQEYQEEDDRVQCPYCTKKFAPATAERHVPLCEKKTKDLKFKDKKIVISGFNRTSTTLNFKPNKQK